MQNERIKPNSIGISWHTTGHLEQQKEENKHFKTMTTFKHSWRLGSSQMWTRKLGQQCHLGMWSIELSIGYRRWCVFFHWVLSLFPLGVYFEVASLHGTPSLEKKEPFGFERPSTFDDKSRYVHMCQILSDASHPGIQITNFSRKQVYLNKKHILQQNMFLWPSWRGFTSNHALNLTVSDIIRELIPHNKIQTHSQLHIYFSIFSKFNMTEQRTRVN